MAKPKKTEQGTWRIQFMVNGVRDGGTFPTAREANEYKARRTAEILAESKAKPGSNKTLRDALRRYAQEVSPTKRGESKEIVRLAAFERQRLPLDRRLGDVTTSDLAEWRDSRLAINARGSVLRDMTLLGSVLEVARREWGWVDVNAMRDVRRPANPDHRKRTITGPEVRRMLRALGYGPRVRSVSNAVAHAFLMALATGMRAGEISGLTWAMVRDDYVTLPMTKNGSSRDVPLSLSARRIIQRMRGYDESLVFGMKSQTLDAMFRKYRDRAGLEGFTFHDSRRNAATRISKRVDPFELCRIFGWKRLDQALTYYAPTVSQLARRLG